MYSLTQGGNLIVIAGLLAEVVKIIFGYDIAPGEIEKLLIGVGVVISWIGRYRSGGITKLGFKV